MSCFFFWEILNRIPGEQTLWRISIIRENGRDVWGELANLYNDHNTVNSETIVLQPHLLHTQPIEALMIKWSHSSTAPCRPLQIRGYFCQWHIKERGGGVCRPDEHLLLFSSPFLNPPTSNAPHHLPSFTMYPHHHHQLACVRLCAYRENLGIEKLRQSHSC